MTQEIVETGSVSNVNFEVQGKQGSSNPLVSGAASQPITLSLYYFPTQQQTAVQSQCASTGSCVNHLSAAVTTNCTTNGLCSIGSQNVPWVSFSRTSTGTYTATFVAGFFNVAPICQAYVTNTNFVVSSVSNPTTSGLTVNVGLNTGSSADYPFTLTCDKQGADISSMSAPILVGSVTTKATSSYRIENYTLGCGSGSVTATSDAGASVSAIGTGQCTLPYGTAFSGVAICTCANAGSSSRSCSIAGTPSSTSITFNSFVSQSGAFDNDPLDVICMGPR
jgi:hypothetical protein